MVASPSTPSPLSVVPGHAQRPPSRRTARMAGPQLAERSLRLIQGSMSGRKVERQSPLLASLHRVSTGALIGLGASLMGLSALALHWQNQWAKSYAQLEAAKVLEHRLHESAAVLEQHHIGAMGRPGQLLPTNSENLIHLPQPTVQATPKRVLPLLTDLASGRPSPTRDLPPLPAGY
ncbi:MAG: hypothetical protein VKP70_12480 [Cyanobacteriota bacterium]|nr:hypothetical protein [Cyanobacteriota bacterium]